MAENSKKPNNELFELNTLLAGVEPAEEPLEDILAEVYGRPVKKPQPEPAEELPGSDLELGPEPDSDAELEPAPDPDPGLEPEPGSELEPEPEPADNIIPFQREPEPDPPPQPDRPSAWVEPGAGELPPELIEAAHADDTDARPDGPVRRKRREKPAPRPVEREEYRAQKPEPVEPVEGGRFARWKARANAFADAMFSQEGEEDENEALVEKYIPGNDDEEQPPIPPRRKRPKRVRPKADDVEPGRLSRTFLSELSFLNQRVFILFLLSFVNGYLAFAGDTALPLPQILRDSPRFLAGLELWLLGWAVVFSLDVIQKGFADIRRRLVGLHTVGVLGALITVIDGLTYCAFSRPGPIPYCAPATLVLFGLVWGAYDKRQADYRACRQAALAQKPYRVTKDEMLWNYRDTFTKEQGDARDFGSQIQAPDCAELMQSRVAPLVLLAAVLFAFLATVGRGNPVSFLWALSVILIAASPLSGLLCYGQPWLKLTRRLEKTGAAAAGWPGVRSSGGYNGVLIDDADLFPAGTVKMTGIRILEGQSREKVASCTASLIRESGSGLSGLFDNLLRVQGGFYRPVEEFECVEGGLSGKIRGEQVLVGSAAFIKVMGVDLQEDLQVNLGVFCAINGRLQGIFALSYTNTPAVAPAIQMLLRDKLVPVLVPRDFNVTPGMVRQKLKIPENRVDYPAPERRLELTELGQEHSDELCALLSRNTVEAYAETIVGCRRLRSAARRNSVVALAASIIGLLLGYYLTAVAAFDSLMPTNLMGFLILWLVPTLLISGNVNRY